MWAYSSSVSSLKNSVSTAQNSSASCWPPLLALQPFTADFLFSSTLGVRRCWLCSNGLLLHGRKPPLGIIAVCNDAPVCAPSRSIPILPQNHTGNNFWTQKQKNKSIRVLWLLPWLKFVHYVKPQMLICQSKCNICNKMWVKYTILWQAPNSSCNHSIKAKFLFPNSEQQFSLADKSSSNHARNLNDSNKTDDDWEVSEAAGWSV